MEIVSLADLYEHFDELVSQDTDGDTLFASSYIRGFIALVCSVYGDESQAISHELCESVTTQLSNAKSELSPQDNAVVNNYWLKLQNKMRSS